MANARLAPASPDALEPLLCVAETAVALHCSEKTVRRLIARGELKAIRIGHLVRISRKHLECYKSSKST